MTAGLRSCSPLSTPVKSWTPFRAVSDASSPTAPRLVGVACPGSGQKGAARLRASLTRLAEQRAGVVFEAYRGPKPGYIPRPTPHTAVLRLPFVERRFVTPCLRHTSAVFAPACCSSTAMICTLLIAVETDSHLGNQPLVVRSLGESRVHT